MNKLIIVILLSLTSTMACAIPKGWKYNHLGVPTQEHNKNELYDKQYKYYTWCLQSIYSGYCIYLLKQSQLTS